MALLRQISVPLAIAVIFALGACATAPDKMTRVTPGAWMNTKLSADMRASLLVAQMTPDEKYHMIRTYYGAPKIIGGRPMPAPQGALGSAGYMPAITRLGIPALQESDAGLGIANPANARPGDTATPLPSGLATAATFDLDLAYTGGAMIGAEAASKGFNVLLAGGVTLVRDPRNGRNFEYAGEDPLLAGVTAGATVRGIESNHIISTVKHYALNALETGRSVTSAKMNEQAMRESDLLAFEIAISTSQPGAVMCGYNLVNGVYDCENDFLLQKVLKDDWRYPGFVMSDWGGTHSGAKAALAGLDQESAGEAFDDKEWFDAPLKQAVAHGQVTQSRIDDMAKRVLRSMFAKGLFDYPTRSTRIDIVANAKVAQQVEEGGAVLLRNRSALLPLSRGVKRIVVIGGHADVGVLSGGGSSQVTPNGGNAVPGPHGDAFPGPVVYDPSSPLKAITAAAPDATVDYLDGQDARLAAHAAAQADVAIVFATKWSVESLDSKDLSLPDHQDALIDLVARANRHTVVVLETGNPVDMPWLSQAGAVLQSWYPGAKGGEAIANLLFGTINPSGRLPVSWPRSLAQLPRPDIKGIGAPHAGSGPGKGVAPGSDSGVPIEIDYNIEGADVGYRWYQRSHTRPLFAFGYGLSYTHFMYSKLRSDVRDGKVHVIFTVRNVGKLAGEDVPQIYATPPGKVQTAHLVGWQKLRLDPGASREVDIAVASLPMSRFDVPSQRWHQVAGMYTFGLAHAADDVVARTRVALPESWPTLRNSPTSPLGQIHW